MPTILIVDDETIFHKGIQLMIAEMNSDWVVISEASDGVEALEKIAERQPDLIITDIKMPRMDGIQLQYIVKERYPEVACVVMSGYNDFQYARESLRLGAKDYLMKPFDREELYKLLDTIKAEWTHVKDNIGSKMGTEDKQVQAQMRQHVLEGLLTGSVHNAETELLESVGISFPKAYITCLIAKLDRDSVTDERYNQMDPSLFSLYIRQFIQEFVDISMLGYVFILSETQVIVLLSHENDITIQEDIEQLTTRIRHEIHNLSNLTITFGMGSPAKDLESIAISFKEAEMALLYRLVIGGDRLLSATTLAELTSDKFDFHSYDWHALKQSVQEGDKRNAKLHTELLITKLCEEWKDPEMIQQQICQILLHFYELAVNLAIAKTWLKGTDVKQVLMDVCSYSSRKELIERCMQLIGDLTDCIVNRKKKFVASPVELVVNYVEEHFAESITLNMMAEIVYLSPTYLSSLFKSKRGQSFVDFLTEKRMEKAKNMLLYSDDKIQVISEATGFTNIRHFNRVFKLATRRTPSEFREGKRE
ncbi:response regulator [Paenibacillus psychroresistens]|uniref:Response regulator n=1 Tax=Paenibacillus psychroresistens TaxID=1778678 RepID=A0A6B8RS80_9BACL|nr:response regulator [Paenibacillus psychroresistens]QGQ98674.1 response regulator [Paenibacillus psychroresistens]